MESLRNYFLCFIPLFVAVDPFGVLPTFLAITGPQTPAQRRKTVVTAVMVACAMALVFFAAGRVILRFLNVEVADFRIAGGFLLLVIAVREIFTPKSSSVGAVSEGGPEPAIVPLAIPLIVGPAVLTTGLALSETPGYWFTAAAFLSVILIMLVMLSAAHKFTRQIRPGTWAALSKIVSILLAAIGVSYIRQGIFELLLAWQKG